MVEGVKVRSPIDSSSSSSSHGGSGGGSDAMPPSSASLSSSSVRRDGTELVVSCSRRSTGVVRLLSALPAAIGLADGFDIIASLMAASPESELKPARIGFGRHLGSAVVKVVIKQIETEFPAVVDVHRDCNRPVSLVEGIRCCRFCKKHGSAVKVAPAFAPTTFCVIDDGSAVASCRLGQQAAAALLGSAAGWERRSAREQAARIAAQVGRTQRMLVAVDPERTPRLLATAVAEDNSTHRCRRLLGSLR
jgi:hypothetical protein